VRRLLLALSATVVLGLTATTAALAQGAAAERSSNVAHLTTLQERGVVSARARGANLFVSTTTGLSVYDIADPRAPRRVGRLDLPVAQNEDVDLAGNVLLMSDEPSGGAGRLHVVDIADPTAPRIIATYDTWAPGGLEALLGLETPSTSRGGIGHTVTCVQGCRWAYLAGSALGIEIVDLRDPARPRFAGRFAAREAAFGLGTHDVQIDTQGLAWVAGGGGTAAYDIRNPARPRVVHRTDRSARGPSIGDLLLTSSVGDGSGRNDLIHHNSQRLLNGSLTGRGGNPAAASDVVAITEEDLYRPGCIGAGSFETWRIRPGRRMRFMDSWRVERDPGSQLACSAHYFEENGGLVAQGWFEQGIRLLDVRRPSRIRQVGYWIPRPSMFWGAIFAPTDPTRQTLYAIDHRRGIDVITVDRSRLTTVRRTPRRHRVGQPNAAVLVDDGLDEVRAGSRFAVRVATINGGARDLQDVTVTLRMPPQVAEVRALENGSYDPATRLVTWRLGVLRRQSTRAVRVRLRRDAPPGPLVFETRVDAAADAMPLDDRFVDRDRITRGRPAPSVQLLSAGFVCRFAAAPDAWR
jgi:LVIVD repeat